MSQPNTLPPNSLESRITDLQKLAESGVTKEGVEVYERLQQVDARIAKQWLTFYVSLVLLAIGTILMFILGVHFVYNPSGWAFGSTSFVTALNGYFFRGFFHIIQHHFPNHPPKELPPQI